MLDARPHVLLLTALPPPTRQALSARFTLVEEPLVAEDRRRVRAIVTNGKRGASASEVDALPNLNVVLTIGVGFEGVDLAALERRAIPLITGRGTNEDGVADHALALLLASARELVRFDRVVRGAAKFATPPASLTNKTLGIVGLGEIGARIARRAEAFGMCIAYHNRKPRADVAYTYFDSARELAAASDFLIVSAPGGASTYHLIDREVLAALGPDGRLVNVGRGEIVDTEALIDALKNGVIAGAALDVFEGEPTPPAAFADLPNLLLTPHIAAASPERIIAMTNHLLRHLSEQISLSHTITQGASA